VRQVESRSGGRTAVAGEPALPLPAMSVILPSLSTRRMRWPPYSQYQMAPSGPRMTPKGSFIVALVAGPPSPE